MDFSKLDRGEKIAGVAAVVLFAALFFTWYKANGATATAWEAFTVLDILFAGIALVALAWALLAAAGRANEIPPSIVTTLGALAFVLIIFRLLNAPGGDGVSRSFAFFPALAASVAIVYAGYLGMREEGSGFANEPPPPDDEDEPAG